MKDAIEGQGGGEDAELIPAWFVRLQSYESPQWRLSPPYAEQTLAR